VIFGLINASRIYLGAQSLEQEICQSLDEAFGVWVYRCLRILTFQLEYELRSIVMPVCPHNPSPSRLKDWIVRSAFESSRTIRERQQAR
jgi:hypothetical protein